MRTLRCVAFDDVSANGIVFVSFLYSISHHSHNYMRLLSWNLYFAQHLNIRRIESVPAHVEGVERQR